MKKILSALTIAAAAGTFSMPALATDFIGKSNIDFFYAELEGGYSFFDGAEAIFSVANPARVQPDGGAYGTVTLGHVSIDDGIIYGYVDRAELWFSYFDHGDDTGSSASVAASSYDRNYWEVGTRFQHYYDQNATNKMMWGFEPFYGEFSSDISVTTLGTVTGTLDTTVYGALLSFEYERMIAPDTMLLFRAAGGAYGSDTDLSVSTPSTSSDDTAGFRGQLALGLKRQLNARTTVGVTGRLDYFSDIARADDNASNGISTDDLLGVSIGANLTYIFAGIYQ